MAVLIPISDRDGNRTDAGVEVSVVEGPAPYPPCPPTPGVTPSAPIQPYANTSPEIATLGYMGASMAVRGYAALGGTRFSTLGNLPDAGLSNLAADTFIVCGTQHTGYWSEFFVPQLGAEQAVWFLAVTADDEWSQGGAAAVLPRLRSVLAKIRTYTQAPVYASSAPDMSALPECKSLQVAFSAATQDAIDTLVGEGALLAGPVLPALSAAEKLNRCHPNPLGERAWGRVLVEVFG